MNAVLEWLLGLEAIRLDRDAPLLLRWSNDVPGWVIFCLTLTVVVFLALVYRRERTTAVRRVVLAAVRACALALVIAVLCGPALVLQRNRTEHSFVALAIDTSLSMATEDEAGGADAGTMSAADDDDTAAASRMDQKMSRLARVVDSALSGSTNALDVIAERNALQLFGFAGDVEPLAFAPRSSDTSAVQEAARSLVADGSHSDVAGAIRKVIERSGGRRLAAIVLATDGRATTSSRLRDAIDLARARQVPVFPIPVGSPDPVRDIEVGALLADEAVFVKDLVAVEVPLSLTGARDVVETTARLIDERTGEVLAEERVQIDPSADSPLELRTKPKERGTLSLRVEVDPIEGERTTENNSGRIVVRVLDNRVRVLYVEAYPRYEYRYLKNALLREETVELSVLLLDADERFVQEGTNPIRRFPETPEELNRFDVILFGDVDPRGAWLSEMQMRLLLDFVGNSGGGFGLVAGERAAPQRFLGTPLERLLPVRLASDLGDRGGESGSSGFLPKLTPDGERSGMLRFSEERSESERMVRALPELFWIARTAGAKPGATVLLEHSTLRTIGGPMPLMVLGRYGAGRIFFQATDDTWRWRRHRGETLHDTFWVQVVRELMRGSRIAQDRRLILRTDRRTYEYGQAVGVVAEVLDAELLGALGSSMRASLSAEGAPGVSAAEERTFELSRLGESSAMFESAVVPPSPGTWVIRAEGVDRLPGEPTSSVTIRVEAPNVETRRIEADVAALQRVADGTGGRMLNVSNLPAELALLPDRSVQIPDDVVEPLWDSRLTLALFTLLIGTEWVLRKAFGLV